MAKTNGQNRLAVTHSKRVEYTMDGGGSLVFHF
jgi:hypothetical protein